MKPYSKEQQLNVKAGTAEADAILKRSFRRGRKQSNNKYGARPEVFQGRTYHSADECLYAQHLEMLRLAGEIKEWKPQFVMELRSEGQHVCNYAMDFRVIAKDGSVELHEFKGVENADWKIKWNLTKVLIPKGAIKDVPKDAKLLLVKRKNGKFAYFPQLLNY